MLPSGEEVKLQRNALEVLERPTAGEMVRRHWLCPVFISPQVAFCMYVLACMHSAAWLLHPPSALAPDIPPRPCCTFIPPLPPSASQQDMSEEEEEERRREQQQSVARGYVYEPAEPHAEGGWQLLGPAGATAQRLPWRAA